MNNGFGNRTPPERKAYIASDDFDGVGAAPPTRPISGILFGLAIVACIAGGYVAAKKGFGRLELPWRANMPMVEDVYKLSADTDISLDRVHNSCKARSDFT